MKDAMRRIGSDVAIHHGGMRQPNRRIISKCSICQRRVWLTAVPLIEPEGVPEPRNTWTLCKRCYQALVLEMRRSPVQSPLRLRIAMGLVAAEFWPHAYPTRVSAYINDHKWIVFMAIGFIVAMLLHLAIIVMIPYLY